MGLLPGTKPFLTIVLLFFGTAIVQHIPAQPVQNRRILDIQLLTLTDSYRIKIRLSEMTSYQVDKPHAGQPLRVSVSNTDVDASLMPNPASNALVEHVWIKPGSSGVASLDFSLTNSDVIVSDWTVLSPNPTIIVSLKTRPSMVQAAVSPALPAASPAAPRREPTVPAPVPMVQPTRPERQKAEAKAPAGENGAEESPVFSARDMAVPDAGQMLDFFKKGQFADAFSLGANGLTVPQSKESMRTLLYFLAECRFQIEQERSLPASKLEPDWEAALNAWQQAERYGPESSFRPLADYRISQIYGSLGRKSEQLVVLDSLYKSNQFPNPDQILMEEGSAALDLYERSRRLSAEAATAGQGNLVKAKASFEEFVQRYRKAEGYPDALFLLGVSHYHSGDYARAYDTMLQATKAAREGSKASSGFNISPDIYALFALAAHHVGKVDLAHPELDANASSFVRVLRLAEDPAIRLEYARILDAGGAQREAMEQYDAVAKGKGCVPQPEDVFEARMALTRYALSDTLSAGLAGDIPYEDYQYPVKAISEMTETCFDLGKRRDLLMEKVRLLAAEGKGEEAIPLVLPLVGTDYFEEDQKAEIQKIIWDILPQALAHYTNSGEPLLALQLFEGFRPMLSNHPKSGEVWLNCADLFLELGMRDLASDALDHIGDYRFFSDDQTLLRDSMQKEVLLNPSENEDFKKKAQDLMGPGNHLNTRARMARQLGKIYANEGQHVYAAQVYLEGTALPALSWRNRCGFFESASEEYEAASIYSKVIEVSWKGIRAYEETGQPLAQAESLIGGFLVRMGTNFRRLGDADKAAKAYGQYLQRYPQGPRAQACRFFLAECYERDNKTDAAIGEYNKVAGKKTGQPFWADLAGRTAAHLNWEKSLPLGTKGNTP